LIGFRAVVAGTILAGFVVFFLCGFLAGVVAVVAVGVLTAAG
jgi:hypothetical protein